MGHINLVITITHDCDLDHTLSRATTVKSVLLWEYRDLFPYRDRVRKPTLGRFLIWVISPVPLWEMAHPKLT
jgi:hypothetical protein